MDFVAAVGADEQSAAVVQPGEGAFDDPAPAAEAGAVLGLASGDQRFDAALPEEAAVLVVVVAAVGDDAAGRCRGRPVRPRTGGTRSSSASSCVMSLRLPPVSVQASGTPPPSTRRWCLSRGRDRPGWDPFACPLFRLHVAGVDDRPRPVDLSAACNSASNSSCSLSQTPASCHAPTAASWSSRSRSPAPAAGASSRSPCAARTRSLATPPIIERLAARIAKAPLSPAAAARSAPTTHPAHPTASHASTSPPP